LKSGLIFEESHIKIKLKTSPEIKKIDIWDENGKEKIWTVHSMNIFIMICYGIMQIKRLR